MTEQNDPPDVERLLEGVFWLYPNLNDTFAYACSDTEQIPVGDGDLFVRYWTKHGWEGLVAIVAWIRGRHPLPVNITDRYKAALHDLQTLCDPTDPAWSFLRDELELTGNGPGPFDSDS